MQPVASLQTTLIAHFEALLNQDLSLQEQITLLRALDPFEINAATLAYCVNTLKQTAITLTDIPPRTLDIVGTGGDGLNTFNISTATAFVVSGTGVCVAKHGNVAATSQCGSFDCLKLLEVNVPTTVAAAEIQLQEYGLTFLFAPYFHPSLKKIAQARRTLSTEKIKTIFNLLGPLLNPAPIKHAYLGVFDQRLLPLYADTITQLNFDTASIVFGGGMDEACLHDETNIISVREKTLTSKTIMPKDLLLANYPLAEIPGGDAKENASIILKILQNEMLGAAREIVVLNSALALQVIYPEKKLIELTEMAKESLNSGKAYQQLQKIRV